MVISVSNDQFISFVSGIVNAPSI